MRRRAWRPYLVLSDPKPARLQNTTHRAVPPFTEVPHADITPVYLNDAYCEINLASKYYTHWLPIADLNMPSGPNV